MSNDAARKSLWKIFEVVFGIPFLLAMVFRRVAPIPFPRGFLSQTFTPAGVIFIVAGVYLVVLARHEFARLGQRPTPVSPRAGSLPRASSPSQEIRFISAAFSFWPV
jgi:hypothetical protein